MDFVLAIFPWILIWHLRMRMVEKIGVGVAMSLGILYGSLLPVLYAEDIANW